MAILWSKFQPGVRIIVLSDSCHSGTVIKVGRDEDNNIINTVNKSTEEIEFKRKMMPEWVAFKTYASNQKLYDEILKEAGYGSELNIKASVKLISGCQDDQYSYDGTFNGVFTSKVKQAWKDGKFQGNYLDFYELLKTHMATTKQTPNYYSIGLKLSEFDNQKPFTVK